MEAEHPVREHIARTHVGDFPVVTIDITSPILAEDLKKVGVVPSKTLKITFPKQLEKRLYKAFIRGYIDGDGTFCLCKNNQYALDIEGTESLLESFREIFQTKLSIPASAKLYTAHKSGIKRLQLRGKNQVMTVLEWLYSDSQIHLDRKYQKFLDIRDRSKN